jgi:5-methylcytosine-specific restriction protein A
VDHIVERSDDDSKRLNWDNLQSLCHSCHNIKTAEEKRKRISNESWLS